ncbi:hypothetical protein Agub_g9708, partial [Astrephomene gubernaculifera]
MNGMHSKEFMQTPPSTPVGVRECGAFEDEQQAPCPSGRPIDHYTPPEHKLSKRELANRLIYAEAKRWSLAHKRVPAPLPLPLGTERCIRQWFQLVDDNGSGRLDAQELEFALQASGIPADTEAIKEIIQMFDFDHDGEINWREFHHFLVNEMMADRDPLGPDYLLPSGTSLPFGSMIGVIRRRKMLSDVERGGIARSFWVVQGPDFLRGLLGAESYALQRDENGRDLMQRIQEIKPPTSWEASPEALEEHKKRIDRLKLFLERTSSCGGGDSEEEEEDDEGSDDQRRSRSGGRCSVTGGGSGKTHGSVCGSRRSSMAGGPASTTQRRRRSSSVTGE